MSSFKQLLIDALGGAGLQPRTAAGTVTSASSDEWALLDCLKRALKESWAPAPANVILEDAAAVKTVTITDGAFALSAIEGSEMFTVWESDPRVLWSKRESWEQLHVPAAAVGDTVTIRSCKALESVLVFYRKPMPAWTLTEVEAGDYKVGDVVYAPTKDGQCYKCLADCSYATGTDLDNTDNWQVQLLPEWMEPLVLEYALMLWFQRRQNWEARDRYEANAKRIANEALEVKMQVAGWLVRGPVNQER